LARIGIAQRNSEGKLHLIHPTFADYFVADFFKEAIGNEN
jgi:hypothetical protein